MLVLRRLVLTVLLIVGGLLIGGGTAFAQGTYLVSDVAVSATASDAVQAQLQAIEQGQREGLRQLVERLAGAGTVPNVATLPIDDYVTSFEVLDETVGPTSYAGRLAVSYDRAAVEQLLSTRGLGVVAEPAPARVLVPLWETGSGLRLWEADNAWKAAWDRALQTSALAPFIVPLGDLQDLALLDADQAVRGEATALAALAARYGAEEAVVARLVGSGAPGAPLEVRARGFGGRADAPYQAAVRQDTSLDVSLERAVRDMQNVYDQRVRAAATTAGPTAVVVVSTEVTSLDGWGRLLQRLESVGGVEIRRVRTFSREQATLDLRVAGGVERLRPELERAGWSLQDDGAGGWRLLQGAAPSGASTL